MGEKREKREEASLESFSREFMGGGRAEAVDTLISERQSRRIRLTGLAGSSPAMALAALKKRREPVVVIANDAESAAYLYNDLVAIAGEESAAIFPSGYRRHVKYGQSDAPSQILRTEALESLRSKSVRWIVTSPEALAEKVPAPEVLSEKSVGFRVGSRCLREDSISRLRDLGFVRVDYVYEPGQYASRGSILDIFSYANELPYRIDFFDDEIDSIRTFNVETQLSEGKVDGVTIVPPTGEAQTTGVALTDVLADSTVVWVQSVSWLLTSLKEICTSEVSDAVVQSGEGDADVMKKVVDYDSFVSRLRGFRTVEFGAPGMSAEGFEPQATFSFDTVAQPLYHKNFEMISADFARFIAEGYRICILADNPHQIERLRAILTERGDDIPFTGVGRTLHQGFSDRERRLCLFTDHQIFDRFHKYRLRSDRARSGKLALSLKELSRIEAGDYIVHIDHGIGRFGGLVRMPVGDTVQEMVKLIYLNDDTIYVNIHSLHKLSKYRGKEGVPPKINKLGTGAWNRIKEKTKTRVKDIARDLIKLYAARREEKGFSFSPDTYMQHELEAGFIYEDTPDQLKAVEAVKHDMESPRPMDRLICGDVGFGKTEIAVRAAFKAAADNKQTAVLVPTTVLALQHYKTFASRLKDMPVRVDYLSRSRKPKEVKQILADLEAGKIDILIGTHKLIGKSVKFKDLGLLVIDEEQKFGVAVKEKLKQLKVNVDTLTMSATPIPRTLQFSLMGARDLSSLNTPPANRQPIITNVTPFTDQVIAEAVNFETSRGGQVFFIANRINRLDELENLLHRVVPGVRVVKGHGQMPPDKLEQAIEDFARGDYDVLLSTTIVENGVDMPNVNTIIIDSAQNFGLSELHQLRGRVGRSSRKAFCYMLTPPGYPLTPEAKRRLQAIESFSDLGSGIHIAMQDLDIRGAGNLLGAEQSGFIADLGYETYQRILKEAVTELKTEEFADTFTDVAAGKEEEFVADTLIESDLQLMLPPSYVPQESERITLYQQLDNMETPEQTETFRESLRDRFGPIPEVTEELIRVVALRRMAMRLGIERVNLKGGKMYIYFVSDENKAYYRSAAFGRVLTYMQTNFRRCNLREVNGKRSMVVSNIHSIAEALNVLQTILTLPAS